MKLDNYYIKQKEATGDKAVSSSSEKVDSAQILFLENFTKLVSLISSKSTFYKYGFITLDDCLERVTCLKHVIENEGGYRYLYDGAGKAITREDELGIAYHFIWFNSPNDNESAKPANPKNAVRIHFKLASNKHLKQFLEKESKWRTKANSDGVEFPKESIVVIFCFDEVEKQEVQSYISDVGSSPDYIRVIDASASHQFETGKMDEITAADILRDESATVKPPRVFISYSHDQDVWQAKIQDPEVQRKRIFDLAERLRSEGVDCVIDQHIANPSEGWSRWMMNNVEDAEFVLVVATETYNRRFRGQEIPNKGAGATWEGAIITQELYNANGKNAKFVPVIFESADAEYIPLPLQSATHYNISIDQNYRDLYYYLTCQPPFIKPLGIIKIRPPLV